MWPLYVRKKTKAVSREGSKGESCGGLKKCQKGRVRMKARSKTGGGHKVDNQVSVKGKTKETGR